jgi:hypothetical protein
MHLWWWLRLCATSQKIAGSRPNEVNEFFSIYLILMFLGSRARPVRRVDNLTAICKADCLDSVGSSTSHNPIGLHGLLWG